MKCKHCGKEFEQWKEEVIDFPIYMAGSKIHICPICGISEEEFA